MTEQTANTPPKAPKFNARDFRNDIATLCGNVNLFAELSEKAAVALPPAMRQCNERANSNARDIVLRRPALDGAP